MEKVLTPIEVRVLGCLVEKELATPDYYPLTLNSLTTACNQKSNRDPLMRLSEPEVVQALDGLRHRGLARQSGEAGRVSRYGHNLDAKLFLERSDLAVLAELLLRGPQTVGELRTRAGRMHPFSSMDEVNAVLLDLEEREDPLVTQLPRQPGRKESRFAHLLGGPADFPATAGNAAGDSPVSISSEKALINVLQADINQLQEDLAELRREFSEFRAQFE